jgi:Na+-transporting NADH:ubiquinone oxidoreductase subunit NqrF
MILGVNKILSDRKNVLVFTQQKQLEHKTSQEEFENIAMTHSNFVFQIFCSDQIIGSNTENMNNSILNYL